MNAKPVSSRVAWLESAVTFRPAPLPVLLACALLTDDAGRMGASDDELVHVTEFVERAITREAS